MDPSMLLKSAMSAVFIYHGVTKNLRAFAEAFNFPLWISSLVIFAEVAGGLGYLLGMINPNYQYSGLTFTKWASIAVIPVLIGAILLVHGRNGFNVMENGWEYQMVLLMVALYLLF